MSDRSRTIVEEELEHQLYHVHVLGVPLWRLIRVPVVEAYMTARYARGRSNHNRVSAGRAPVILFGIARSLLHLLRLRKRQFLIIGFPRRRLEGQEWVDPFSDPIIDFLGSNEVLCVEKPFVGEHCRPPRTKGIIYYDWVTALALFASSIAFLLPQIIFRREISELGLRVRGVVGTPVQRIKLLAARAIVRFWIERTIARGLLALVRPRAVLLTLRRHHYPLICACKTRGIPVYELQHGAIAEGGYKYSTPYDMNLDPDAFLAFGEYWKAADWGLPARAVESVGFKYIVDRKVSLASPLSPRGDKVMLVSQPHVSGILGAAFGSIVRMYPDSRFILKLHPQDVSRWWERYAFAKESNVEVYADRGPDLYSLFAQCKCVLGRDSTVLFEAAFFGLKVGILNQDGTNRCSALEYVGHYNFYEIRDIEQVGELLRAVTNPTESGDNPFFAAFDEAYFLRLLQEGPGLRSDDPSVGTSDITNVTAHGRTHGTDRSRTSGSDDTASSRPGVGS